MWTSVLGKPSAPFLHQTHAGPPAVPGRAGGAQYSLQGEGVVVLAGLAVPDKVATLLTESQQVLGITSADGAMIPSGERTRGESELGGDRVPRVTSKEAQCPQRAAAGSSLP